MLPAIRYPAARVTDRVIRMHGVDVPDPYQWLDDAKLPETQEWLAQQAALTAQVVGRLEDRNRFLDVLRTLPGVAPTRLPMVRGTREFVLQPRTGGSTRLIEKTGAEERVHFDPDRYPDLRGSELHPDFVFLSPSARYLAAGLGQPGSDWVQIHVFDLEQGTMLPFETPPSAHVEISWAPDESGFHHSLIRAHFRDSDRPDGVYWHALGASGRDELVFDHSTGEGHGALPLFSDDGRWVFVKIINFVTQDAALYVFEHGKPGTLRRLIRYGAPLNVIGQSGTRLYIESRLGNEHGRVVSLDLAGETALREVVPEQPEVLEMSNHTVAARFSRLLNGRLLLTYVKDVCHEVRAYDAEGRLISNVPLPGKFTVLEIAGRGSIAEVALTSFASPFTRFRVDPVRLSVALHSAAPGYPTPALDVTQTFCSSPDGTRVPIFVIRPAGALGPLPTLLYGYGGWGSSLTPSFREDLLAWVALGGAYAVAITRGGGEYGKQWHEAGARLNRIRTFEDFCACAEALVDQGIARPGGVAIRGLSNGALLVTASIMRRPELFAAATAGVPLVDVVTLMSLPAGAALAQELGDPTADVKSFEYMLSYSPLQNVRPHPQRPSLMLLPGGRDERCPPAGAFKLTAAMQAVATPAQVILLNLFPEGGHVNWPWDRQCEMLADELAFLRHFALDTGETPA